MEFQIKLNLNPPQSKIKYNQNIFLIGSCFTEHIGKRFKDYNWNVCENPTGIIFNPNSIRKAMDRVIYNQLVHEDELIFHNELWHHWDFHSRFSNISKQEAYEAMNKSIADAYNFASKADWFIFTIGSAFQYFTGEGYGVSNCHRVPANQFEKKLLSIEAIISDLQHIVDSINNNYPNAKIIFTISPVRHIKDGVVENNRSKARIIEAVHQLVDNDKILYYPAYELLIDVLRDYRYYDADLVHPNYAATQSVWEYLCTHFFDGDTQDYLKKMVVLQDGFKHRTRFPQTKAHYDFLKNYLAKVEEYQAEYPETDFGLYISHFENEISKHPLFNP